MPGNDIYIINSCNKLLKRLCKNVNYFQSPSQINCDPMKPFIITFSVVAWIASLPDPSFHQIVWKSIWFPYKIIIDRCGFKVIIIINYTLFEQNCSHRLHWLLLLWEVLRKYKVWVESPAYPVKENKHMQSLGH